MGNCHDNFKMLDELGGDQGQTHLMNHWQNLPSKDKRRVFQEQLSKVNVNKVLKIYKKSSYSSSGKSIERGSTTQTDRSSATGEYYPIPDSKIMRKQKILEQKQELDLIGLSTIKNGQVGVFIMAGNQNHELNLELPLGIYDIGLDSACSIFEILVRKLARLQKMSGADQQRKIKLYIMTNTENKNEIKNHFKDKNYFGYGQNNVFFFSQPVEPVVDQNGKIVLKSQASIYMSPQGNGMIYKAIKDKKLISHLDNNGIKYIFLGPINNVLLKIADPTTLGYLIRQKKEVVATCLESNEDCLGYYGLTSDLKHIKVYEEKLLNPQKKWANTGSCYLTVDFLVQAINNDSFLKQIEENFQNILIQLPVHKAELNQRIITKCLYFQSFYHKIFELTDNIEIIEIDPACQFAPIKINGQGKYSLTYVKDSLRNWNKLLLSKAGITFQGQGHVQIHPALTYQGQNIQEIIQQKNIKKILKLPQFIL